MFTREVSVLQKVVIDRSVRRELFSLVKEYGESHILDESALSRKELNDAITGEPVALATQRAVSALIVDFTEDPDSEESDEDGDDEDEEDGDDEVSE